MATTVFLRLPSDRLLRFEQDGFLRPFDVATVLWPAGYLLAQWIGNQCTGLQGKRVLELGAGIGAVSITAAECGASVVATDKELRSLGLTMANSVSNGIPIADSQSGASAVAGLTVQKFDWSDVTDLERILDAGPFDLVLGAALQFESRWDELWPLLQRLSSSAQSPRIVLVHTTNSIEVPAAVQLCEVSRTSGKEFGMVTRQNDLMSDFEVVELAEAGAVACTQHTDAHAEL
jgi:predicted nicotinamide N-methyase